MFQKMYFSYFRLLRSLLRSLRRSLLSEPDWLLARLRASCVGPLTRLRPGALATDNLGPKEKRNRSEVVAHPSASAPSLRSHADPIAPIAHPVDPSDPSDPIASKPCISPYASGLSQSPSKDKESSAGNAPRLSNSYIIAFWVGLMDGDGSIQVNHWRKKCLQYRIVIKLRSHPENVEMLHQIAKVVGGRVSIQKNFVLWVENTRGKVQKILKILQSFAPPLTTRLRCQLEFALLCLKKNDIDWYLENRKLKYSKRAIFTEFCKASAEKLLSKPPNGADCSSFGSFGSDCSFGASCVGPVKKISHSEFGSQKRLENDKNIASECETANAWFAGFVEAEGCFNVHKKRRLSKKTGKKRLLFCGRFIIGQKFDVYLLESILSFLSSNGRVLSRKSEIDFYFIQIYRKDVLGRIQNQFAPGVAPLLGYKKVEYEEFFHFLSQNNTRC